MAQFTSDNLTPEVGARLREARIAKGLSEADAAARLRTTPHYIERMDAGDVRSLPPEPYRKSFIKEYARLVGLKLEVLLSGEPIPPARSEGILGAVTAVPEVAKKVTKEAASLATEVTKTTVKTTETVVKKAGEGVKEAVQELRAKELWEEAEQVRRERLGLKEEEAPTELRMRPQRPATPAEPTLQNTPRVRSLGESDASRSPISERRQPTQRLDLDKEVRREAESYEPPETEEYEMHTGPSRSTKVIVGLLIVIAAIVAYSVVSKRAKNTPPEPVVTEQPKVETKQAPTKPAPAAQPKKDSAAATALATVPTDTILKFAITAKSDVWVSVTPDVGNGFRGTMKAGESKQFTAKDKYIVYLGNQGSVNMTLNGRPLSGLPTVPGSNMVVRNVLLTKDKAVPATADQNPTEIKKQAIENVTPPPAPVKHTTPHPQPVTKHPAPKKPEVKKPAAKKPAPKQPNGAVKKRIPTTQPVLPQAN